MTRRPDLPDEEVLRLDVALVRAGLARSRGAARDLVAAGEVHVDGAPARRISQRVTSGAALSAAPRDRVSRGADKLQAAFVAWEARGLSAQGLRCLDVGASTGGFTQVLLGHGAAEVVALDVGTGQLAPSVAADPRVRAESGVNIRDVDAARSVHLGAPFDLVVADLSFISLTLVVPVLRRLLAPSGQAILLVKPQFEVGRSRLGRSGVVRDRHDRLSALRTVLDAAAEQDLPVRDVVHSPVRGGGGNREYLVWVRPGADAPSSTWVRARAEAVVGEEGSG